MIEIIDNLVECTVQQSLELALEKFHSLLIYDFNVDGISEIMVTRLLRNESEIKVIHPKHMVNCSVKINELINTACIAQTNLDRNFELISGDIKGVLRINSREGKPFFSKDVRDGVKLPSSILSSAPGDLNGNKLAEIVVGCNNGEVVMIERIPGKKLRWDKIRGFSLGRIFDAPVQYVLTGDFNGSGQTGFIAGSVKGLFKEIEFRPQLQKFDLIGEFQIEGQPSFCFNGDFDRDGISEVMIGEQSGKLNIFKKNQLMSTHNLDGAITCGIVGDVDNDRQLEIVVGTSRGSFHILRQNTIESYEGYSNINDLKIGDLSGNRQNELIFSIDKCRILAFIMLRDKIKEKPNVELLPFRNNFGRVVSIIGEQPDLTNAFCPNCKLQVRFIEQYRRWYCDNCRQYIAPIAKQETIKKAQAVIEAKTISSPYLPTGPYPAYEPKSTIQDQTIGIDRVKTVVEKSLGEVEVKEDRLSGESKLSTSEVEANYFLPMDLESDPKVGVEFINDILKIKHVILIHSQSGVPLFSQGFGKSIDVSLTSGFLSAVGTFTEEMAGETEKRVGVFSEIGREGFWILIYESEQSKAAFLISEKIGEPMKKRIKIFVNEFESRYKDNLTNFDGFISIFSGTTELLEKHLRLEYLYPLKVDTKKMRLTAIAQNEKKLAKIYSDFFTQSNEEVSYISELKDMALQNTDINITKEEIIITLIKYLENGMLIPLPPPPDDQI